MSTLTVKWVSWGNSKKAHAKVRSKRPALYRTLCGIDLREDYESIKPHCAFCNKEIQKYKEEGWIVRQQQSKILSYARKGKAQ